MNRIKVFLETTCRHRVAQWVSTTFALFMLVVSSGHAQSSSPNCLNLDLGVGANDSVAIFAENIVPNIATSAPVNVVIKNSFGGNIGAYTLSATTDVISFGACNLIGQQLEAEVSNNMGRCWSMLTIKHGNSKSMTSNFNDSVWCLDPILALDPNDFENPAWYTTEAPYTLLPTITIPCKSDVLLADLSDRNGDGFADAADAADYYAPLYEDCNLHATDWVDAFDCDEQGGITKIIIREWEAYDKENNRTTARDTITVFALPQLTVDNFIAPEKDTLYCQYDTTRTITTVTETVCWKQIVGTHSDGTMIYYPVLETGNATPTETLIIRANGSRVTVGNLIGTDTVQFSGKPSYVIEVFLGDQVLSNNGQFITVDSDWFYATGEHGFWVDLCVPTLVMDTVLDICDVWEGADCTSGIRLILPSEPSTGTADSCQVLCINNDILSRSKCFTFLFGDEQVVTNSCPRLTRRQFELKQACFSTAVTATIPGNCAATADASGVDFTNAGDGRFDIEQWIYEIDTIAPLFTPSNEVSNWTTGSHDCLAEVRVPDITVKDDCSGVKLVKATIGTTGDDFNLGWVVLTRGENGVWTHSSNRTFPLSCGTYPVAYELVDSCHNDTIISQNTIVVSDNRPPTTLLDDELRVTLGSDDIWLDATDLDRGSSDNCGIRMILARRVDWMTACGTDICDAAELSGITSEAELDAFIRSNGITSTLDDSEVEEYYADAYEWLVEDGEFCDNRDNFITDGWESSLKSALGSCLSTPLTIADNSAIGGGWAKAIPLCCADACDTVDIEVLVVDKECNYSIGRSRLIVDFNIQVDVAEQFDTLNMSCHVINDTTLPYVAAIQAAQNGNYTLIDAALGTLVTANGQQGGNYVDADGNILSNELIYFSDSVINTGGNTFATANYEWARFTQQADLGVIVSNCGSVNFSQTISLDLDSCGVGSITRTFSNFASCSGTSSETLTQVINVSIEEDEAFIEAQDVTLELISIPSTGPLQLPSVFFDAEGNLTTTSNSAVSVNAPEDGCRSYAVIDYSDFNIVLTAANSDSATYVLQRIYQVQDTCANGAVRIDTGQVTVPIRRVMSSLAAAPVSGVIVNSYGSATVHNVEVYGQLDDGSELMSITDETGQFAFDAAMGASITIEPVKNTTASNGVDILDILRIQAHLLDKEPLTGTFEKIAADVNNDGRISAKDAILMQRVTLGKDEYFPNNNSWRFFNEVSGEEKYPISAVEDAMKVNFIGVKIGDVNQEMVDASRSSRSTTFEVEDVKLSAGQDHMITLSPKGDWMGYQAVIRYDASALELEGVFGDNITSDNWILEAPGKVRVIATAQQIGDLTLQVRAIKDAQVSRSLAISGNAADASIAVGTDNTPQSLALEFTQLAPFVLYQNSPNPMQESTQISFYLSEAQNAKLRLFDSSGKLLQLIQGDYTKGMNTVNITADQLGVTGVVYYQLETANFAKTKRMAVIR